MRVWIACLLTLRLGSAWAASYYVDVNSSAASDTNAGTSAASPWKTIQKAASTMVAGDTVNIVAGTYNETITMKSSGTATSSITYQRYGPGAVVIKGPWRVTRDYVVVKGLEISGDSLYTEGTHCQILDNNIHHSGTFGVFIHGSYHLFKNNTIANNGSSWGGQVTTGWGTGHHIVFEHNDVSDTQGQGEDLMQYLNHDFIARGNRFHDLGSNGRHNDCYQSGGGEYNIWMINNTFENLDNVQYFMVGPSGDKDHVWRGNLFWGLIGWGFNGAPSGMRVINNTFGTAAGGYGYSGGGTALNNIYNDWGTQCPYGAATADYNLIKPIPTWCVTKQSHDLWGADAKFVDFVGRDFHLQSISPCIDAGTFPTKTTSAGSGTQLPVADAHLFVDGFGIADGDSIQLQGQTQVRKIVSIDYSTNVLTLDLPLTWTSGQGVSVPYSGLAPDLGAYEYQTTPPAADGGAKSDALKRDAVKKGDGVIAADATPPRDGQAVESGGARDGGQRDAGGESRPRDGCGCAVGGEDDLGLVLSLAVAASWYTGRGARRRRARPRRV